MSLNNVNNIFVPAYDMVVPYHVNPGNPIWSNANIYYMNSGNVKQALITTLTRSGNITDILFNLSQSVASTTGQAMYVSIQSLDVNGNPLGTGSTYGGSLPTYYNGVFTQNSSQTITLSSPATGAREGDVVAVVFEWNGSITGNICFAIGGANYAYISRSGVTGGWNKTITNARPQISFKYDDGNYYGLVPVVDYSISHIVGWNIAANVEYGRILNIPFNASLIGGYFVPAVNASNNSYAFSLFLGTGVLSSVVINSNIFSNTLPTTFIFPIPIIIQPNINYYLSVGMSGAATTTFYSVSGHNTNAFSSWALGSGCCGVNRLGSLYWNGSQPLYSGVQWNILTQEIPPIGFLFSQLDDGISSNNISSNIGRNILSYTCPGIQRVKG